MNGTLLHLWRCLYGSYVCTYIDAKYVDTAPSRTYVYHLYVYLSRSLPRIGCACENVRDTDRANTGICTDVTPEMYDWNRGKSTGIRTANKHKPFRGMYHMCVCLQHICKILLPMLTSNSTGLSTGLMAVACMKAAKSLYLRRRRKGCREQVYASTYIHTYVRYIVHTTTSSL